MMFKLYLSTKPQIVATIFIVSILAYIVYAFIKRNEIKNWSKLLGILLIIGLFTCIAVVVRDGYGFSSQPVFTFSSTQSNLCCLAALGMVILTVIYFVVKSVEIKRILFFAVSGLIVFKMIVIEFSRIFLR